MSKKEGVQIKDRIVCIEWYDATFTSGYYDIKYPERYAPAKTRTVGHLVKQDRKAVIVSQERFYDDKGVADDERYIVTIPKGMIRKITELKG